MVPKLRQTKFIRTFAPWALCVTLALLAGVTTQAKAQKPGIPSSNPDAPSPICDTITVGGPASWQPVSYVTSDGRQTGLGIDIIREYAKREGIDVQVDIELPWARVLDLMLNGKIDVAAGAYFTDERQRIYQYSDPFFTDEIIVFQHADRRFPFSKIEDLKRYRGARPHGGSLGREIDSYSKHALDITYSPTNDRIFNLLLAGHVDYVLLARYDGVATVRKLGLQDIIIPLEPVIAENLVRLMFSRSSPCVEHVEQINKLIAELASNGTLQKRIDYHLNQTVFKFETGS